MAKYVTQTALSLPTEKGDNTILYRAGNEIELSDEQAQELLESGAVRRPDDKPAEQDTEQSPVTGQQGVESGPMQVPERPSNNAKTEDWRAYAESVGVDVPDGTKRDDIIAMVDAHQAG